jgi:Cellulase (glycosyl hydrolase family 5)
VTVTERDADASLSTPAPVVATHRPARATAIALGVTLLLLTVVLGYVDGTGLFAPENWVDAGLLPTYATSPAWATVVFLPLLVLGSSWVAYRTVRAMVPGAPSRWAFWGSWSSVVLVSTLAKSVYSGLLLVVAGPDSLHVAPTVRAVAAEVGLTGAKYVLLGLVAASVAALTHLVSSRRHVEGHAAADLPSLALAPATALPSPVWFLVGAGLASWAELATSAWISGSVIALPLLGFLGAYLLGRLTWRGLRRRLVAGAGGWALAVTVTTASALGFLLPWVVDGALHGFGGALFPVAGALLHLGVGSLAGLLTVVLAWAWRGLGRSRLGVRLGLDARSRLRTAIGLGLVLGLTLGLAVAPTPGSDRSYAVPAAASADAGGLLPITVDRTGSPALVDSAGRQVLLRGVNVNQLIDYGQRDASMPTVRSLSDTDYAQMASEYGFDVQRLALSWSALEPRRGVIDTAYIGRVRASVDAAAAHGIYTVLDMHQDTYSKYVTAAPGTTCRAGAEPEFGNDGAPGWATLTDGAPGCGFQGRDLSPNVENAFTNLYDDRDGIGGELARTWAALAQEFAGDTAVVGYDLLNEPGPGNAPGMTSSLLLGRLYQQAISAIRAAESGAGGYHHVVFFEPSILWSGLGFDVAPPVGFSDDPVLVFSPHLYSESITMDQGLGVTLTSIEQGFEVAARQASAYAVPLWSGEWGWFGDLDAVRGRYDRYLDQQDARLVGSAVWVWKKACGDPQTGVGETTSGGLHPVSCSTGQEVAGPRFLTATLSEAYPRSAPGRLSSLTSSSHARELTLAGSGAGRLDVWAPGTSTPVVTQTGLTDVTVTSQTGGGWRVTAHASGAYTLSLH